MELLVLYGEGCEPAKARTSLKFIDKVESFIDRDLLIRFSETYDNNKEWDGEITAHDLFIFWRKIKKSANSSCMPNEKIGNSTLQSDNAALNSDQTVTVESDEFNEFKEPLASSSVSSEHIALMNIEDSSNSSVGSPFKRALFWPETKMKKVKKQTKEYRKVPAVATSEEWKKYFKVKKEEKEKKEREKEREKEERKRVREAKKQEKLILASAKKIKKKTKAKTKSKNTDSESEESTELVFNDSSDSDSSVGLDTNQNVNAENTTKNNLMTEKYYAVYYEEKYYIGRITSLYEKESNVKFLKEIMENSFTWPKKTDEECVKNSYIFFGPLTMFGNDPFFLSVGDIRKIKSAYRQLKHKLKKEESI